MNLLSKSSLESAETLNAMWNQFSGVIPNMLNALALFVVGYIIIKIIVLLVRNALRRIDIDQLVEKLVDSTEVQESISLSLLLSKVVQWILMILLIVTIAEVLHLEAVSTKLHEIVSFIPNIIAAILILAVGTFIATTIKSTVNTLLVSMGMEGLSVFGTIIFYFVIFMALTMALDQINIDISFIKTNFSLIIIAALISFSVATILAMVQIFPNIIAYIRNREVIKVGETIEVNGMEGKVKRVDRLNLVIIVGDKELLLPNKEFIN